MEKHVFLLRVPFIPLLLIPLPAAAWIETERPNYGSCFRTPTPGCLEFIGLEIRSRFCMQQTDFPGCDDFLRSLTATAALRLPNSVTVLTPPPTAHIPHGHSDPQDHHSLNSPVSSGDIVADTAVIVPDRTLTVYYGSNSHGELSMGSPTSTIPDCPTTCFPLMTTPPPREPFVLVVEDKEGLRGMAPSERVELVSSLYGPGAVIGWFCLVLSVLVSWTLHPKWSRRDAISNDLIAALTLPAVAAGHCLHQIFLLGNQRQSANTAEAAANDSSLPQPLLLTSWQPDRVQLAAAMEAPLTISEDFIIFACVLYGVSALRGHYKRVVLVLVVELLCFVVQLVLFTQYVTVVSSWNEINLQRPFIFGFTLAISTLAAVQILFLGNHAVQGVRRFVLKARGGRGVAVREVDESGAARQSSQYRGGLRSAKVRVILFAVSAVLPVITAVWVKYFSAAPLSDELYAAFLDRFVPRSNVPTNDLDQQVAKWAGIWTLASSIINAVWALVKARRSPVPLPVLTSDALGRRAPGLRMGDNIALGRVLARNYPIRAPVAEENSLGW